MGVLGLAERGNAYQFPYAIGNTFLAGSCSVQAGVDGTVNYAVVTSLEFTATAGAATLSNSFSPGAGSGPLDLNGTVVYIFQIINNGPDVLPIEAVNLGIPYVALTSWGYFSQGVFSGVDGNHNLGSATGNVGFSGFTTSSAAIDPVFPLVADTYVDPNTNSTVMTSLRTFGPFSVEPGGTSSLIVYTARNVPSFNTATINDGGTCATGWVAAPNAAAAYTVTTADAGLDQTVNEGAMVTLDGSQSAGANLTFSWVQVPQDAGPLTVTLLNPTSATPTFIAPLLPGGLVNQTLSFQLTVTSGADSATDVVNVLVVNLNHPPVANAGPDQAVNEAVMVTLDGTGSYDPDSDPFTYLWTQTGGPHVTLDDPTSPKPKFAAPYISTGSEPLTFTLTVSDTWDSTSDSVTVTVENINHLPAANAGNSRTVGTKAPVTLDGSQSSDPDGDALTYQWTQVGGPQVLLSPNASTVTPSFVAPAFPTQLTFNLVVTDVWGAASTNLSQVVITVDDAPRCDRAMAVPGILWPPDHKLREIRIVGVTDPNRKDKVTIHIDSITQDEPVNGLGDGDTSPDGVRTGDWDGRVLLRSERGGKGDGRGYTVNFTATDSWGLSCSGEVWIGVPHHDPKRPPMHRGGFHDSERR
jgi:hypothetical protein